MKNNNKKKPKLRVETQIIKMTASVSLLLLLSLFCAITNIQGACPITQYPVIQDFSIEKYLGIWYVIERTSNTYEDGENFRCSRSLYQEGPRQGSFKFNWISNITNRVIGQPEATSSYFSSKSGFTIQATVTSYGQPLGPNIFKFTFNDEEESIDWQSEAGILNPKQYNVYATDYTTYAIVYETDCVNDVNVNEKVWILSRTPVLDSNTLNMLHNKLAADRVDVSKLKNVDQNCPLYWPIDCKVPEIKDFSIEKYLGVWYGIERTNNVVEKDIRCSRSLYKVGPRDDVFSVQWTGNHTDNKLITARGYAIKALRPGSSSFKQYPSRFKLTWDTYPTWPLVAGSTNPKEYNIIATDYQTYAVLYDTDSCDSTYRYRERVWILSRTPKLDASTLNDLHSFLESSLKLDISKLVKVDQSCPLTFPTY